MAKKTRYPRKLRQTIEKIAAARDERAAKVEEDNSQPGLYDLLGTSFLRKNSVARYYVQADHMRMRMVHHIAIAEPRTFYKRVFVDPPWVTDQEEGDGSE